MRPTRRVVLFVLAISATTGAAGRAQEPVTSFDALAGRIQVGQRIQVTDSTGREVGGRLEKLSGDGLLLKAHGLESFAAADVRIIRRRDHDSLKNGALIGLGVGGGLATAWCVGAIADSGEVNARVECAEGFIVYPALGAVIGLASDAMIPGKLRVIYRAPGVRSPVTVVVVPLLPSRSRGLAVALSF